MAKRKLPELQKIEGSRRITQETDPAFLLELQRGLLLALKEQGRLNEMQYRAAAEGLKGRKWTPENREGGARP